MRSEASKGDVEIEVFRRFLQASGLPIDPASAVKQLPPYPDILCVHQADGPMYFELTELCDPTLAKLFNDARPEPTYVRTSDPSSRIFRKKLGATYSVSQPIELLCYMDSRIVTPDSIVVPTLRSIFESRPSPFRRAWLLGETGAHEIAT
jgi:hypothetical protein